MNVGPKISTGGVFFRVVHVNRIQAGRRGIRIVAEETAGVQSSTRGIRPRVQNNLGGFPYAQRESKIHVRFERMGRHGPLMPETLITQESSTFATRLNPYSHSRFQERVDAGVALDERKNLLSCG